MLLIVLGALFVVAFALAMMASIGLHEVGHLIPARRFGCRVTQYFIGFGPTVWSRQRGETEYGVKAIPFGGYVKIVGMLPPGAGDLGEIEHDADGNEVLRVRKSNTGLFAQLVSDARAAEWELVRPDDDERLFYRLPPWKKVVVMAGGPTVNLLIAFVLLSGLWGIYGIHSQQPDAGQPVVAEVSQCVLPAAEADRGCQPGDPEAPAASAGLRPGDRITAFNGTAIKDWQQLSRQIRGNESGDAVIDFVRDGEQQRATTSTTVTTRLSQTGEQTSNVGFLGITPTSHTVVDRLTPLQTLEQMGTMAADTVRAIGTLPVKTWGVAKAVVGVEERAADSPMSPVGGGRLAAEIGSTDQLQLAQKLSFFVLVVAGFNLFMGLFNFVPLLPMDGGHIAGALWEGLRRTVSRVLRRPDPGYVDTAKLLPVAYVVAMAILVMGAVLVVGDVVAPVDTPF